MQPKKRHEEPDLFRSHLGRILNRKHPLFVLAEQIDWRCFEEAFGSTYVEETGRPGIPIRLMVGLHYLKHTFNESDESVLDRFLENPYWQYFCGFEYFQHQLPIDSSSLTRFRKRIGDAGCVGSGSRGQRDWVASEFQEGGQEVEDNVGLCV
jgi:IS5 family transposase